MTKHSSGSNRSHTRSSGSKRYSKSASGRNSSTTNQDLYNLLQEAFGGGHISDSSSNISDTESVSSNSSRNSNISRNSDSSRNSNSSIISKVSDTKSISSDSLDLIEPIKSGGKTKSHHEHYIHNQTRDNMHGHIHGHVYDEKDDPTDSILLETFNDDFDDNVSNMYSSNESDNINESDDESNFDTYDDFGHIEKSLDYRSLPHLDYEQYLKNNEDPTKISNSGPSSSNNSMDINPFE